MVKRQYEITNFLLFSTMLSGNTDTLQLPTVRETEVFYLVLHILFRSKLCNYINARIPVSDLIFCKITVGHTSIYFAFILYIPPETSVVSFLKLLLRLLRFSLLGIYLLLEIFIYLISIHLKTNAIIKQLLNFFRLDLLNAKQYNYIRNADGKILDLIIFNAHQTFKFYNWKSLYYLKICIILS